MTLLSLERVQFDMATADKGPLITQKGTCHKSPLHTALFHFLEYECLKMNSKR